MIPNSFIYNDSYFFDGIDELIEHLDNYEDAFDNENDNLKEAIKNLDDDWSVDCEETTLEPIFVLTKEKLVDAINDHIYNHFEDRFPEDSDSTDKEISEAIKQSIDIEKLNSLLPKLYYPNGKKFTITKADLLEEVLPRITE